MVALLPRMSHTVVKTTVSLARSFDDVRRFIAYGLSIVIVGATVAYVTLLIGTTMSAAERRTASIAIQELTAQAAKEEALYLSLLAEVNKKEVIARGFVQTDPAFVVRSSIAKSFSLVHVIQ